MVRIRLPTLVTVDNRLSVPLQPNHPNRTFGLIGPPKERFDVWGPIQRNIGPNKWPLRPGCIVPKTKGPKISGTVPPNRFGITFVGGTGTGLEFEKPNKAFRSTAPGTDPHNQGFHDYATGWINYPSGFRRPCWNCGQPLSIGPQLDPRERMPES